MKYTLIALLFIAQTVFAQKQTRPNVIVIIADDLGRGDVSAYKKGTIQTPNIDKLANGGVRFNNGYATSSTCTPSRFAMLTGTYPWRNDAAKILPGDAPMLIDTASTTLADMFKNKGYNTGIVGKWHLGLGNGSVNWNKEITETPNDLGFDYSYIMAATNDRVPTVYVENRRVKGLQSTDSLFVNYDKNFEGVPTALSNPELLTKLKWHHRHNNSVHNGVSRIGFMTGGKSALWSDEDMADEFLGKTLGFIDNNLPKKTKKPFFLYYALHQPHVPRVPHPRFAGKSGLGVRGDVILEGDWCVGELIKKLEKEGLLSNTIIVFSSDNGPVLNDGYYDEAVEKKGNHDAFGGLRGGKYSLFEAGPKVPFLVYWKGKIKPKVSEALVCQVDFMASFAALIQAESKAKDSQNLLNAFLGKSEQGRSDLVIEAMGRLAYRQGDYAFIPSYKGKPVNEEVNIEVGNAPEVQLYDVKNDPAQKMNIAKDNPEKVKAMQAAFKNATKKQERN
jgi:arylsulfatase A-like enzyme